MKPHQKWALFMDRSRDAYLAGFSDSEQSNEREHFGNSAVKGDSWEVLSHFAEKLLTIGGLNDDHFS